MGARFRCGGFYAIAFLIGSSITIRPAHGETSTTFVADASANYGLLGWLDHRSSYGTSWYPEPFRVDESDVDNELRLDYQHVQGRGTVSHELHAEIEKSFGVTTIEVEGFYDINTQSLGGGRHGQDQGFGNIDLGVRTPIWQYVSPSQFFDTTMGVAFELGIPTNSPESKNTEIVPKIFNDTRIGDHFSVQTICGISYPLGSKPDGGTRKFEYGVILGWAVDHDELPLPDVQTLIPIAEFAGESGIDHSTANTSNLSATLGVRANLNSVGAFQPRLGAGFVLPIDKGAKDELTQGFVLSLVLEY